MNPEQCRQHPLNNSGTKYSFKFGKSQRFKPQRLYTENMYSIERKNNSRTCGFGFGNRSPVGKTNGFPSPQKYDLPSTITNKAKTFGLSRQQTKFQSFLLKAMKQASMPGPNSYLMPSSIQQNHKRRFSLREKLPTQLDLVTKNNIPPPNAYCLDREGNASNGKFVSSKYRNIRKIVFFGRESSEQKTMPVGPGSYNISKQYNQSDSRLRKTCNNFGSALRPTPQDKSKKYFPGPGMYQTFSQFPNKFN